MEYIKFLKKVWKIKENKQEIILKQKVKVFKIESFTFDDNYNEKKLEDIINHFIYYYYWQLFDDNFFMEKSLDNLKKTNKRIIINNTHLTYKLNTHHYRGIDDHHEYCGFFVIMSYKITCTKQGLNHISNLKL